MPATEPLLDTAAHPVRALEFTVFTCRIQLATTNPSVSLTAARSALVGWGRRFSRFEDDSELTELNRRAGSWIRVSRQLHELLALGLRAAVESRGLFNIGILPWLLAAGAPDGDEAPPEPGKPCPPVTELLELAPGRARLRAGHAIDLNGLVKGVWADQLCQMLGPNAACSVGGDVACRGEGPHGSGWPVELPDKRVIMVRNGGVATSGTGRRRGRKWHHIIDPRTGRPSNSDVSTVSVLAPRCADAEWLATSLVVGGSRALPELRRLSGVTTFFETGAA